MRLVCTSIGVLIFAMYGTAGGQASDLDRQIERARADLAAAEARVERERAILDAARSRMDALRHRLSLILADLDRLPLEADRMRQRLPEARASLTAAQGESDRAQAAADAAGREVEAITARLAVLKQSIDARRKELADALAGAPETVAAARRVESSDAAIETATQAVHERLKQDAQYQRLSTEAEALRQQVQQLREARGADPGELARASQAWMTAQSAAGAYLGKAVDGDEAVRSAKAELAEAIAAKRAVEASNASAVESDPRVLELRAAMEGESRVLAAAQTERRAATAASASSAGRVESLRAEIARIESELASLESRVAQLRRDYDATFDQHRLAELEYTRALQRWRVADQARRSAEARLRDLLARR